MGIFSGIGKSFSDLGGDIEHVGKTVSGGLSTAANTVASGVSTAANTVASGVSKGVDDVGKVTVTGASDIETGVSSAAKTVERGGSEAFDRAVETGQEVFNDIKSDLEQALSRGEAAILVPLAKGVISDLENEILTLRTFWGEIEHTLANEIGIIKEAAHSRDITEEAKQAFHEVSTMLAPIISTFANKKNFASFGIEFGASAALGAAAEAGVGLLSGIPDIFDVRGYGTVGVSVGVEEGVEGDIAFVFNNSAPADSGGPSLNVIASLDVAAGGTVVVSYNLPDFSFGGISVGLAAGEEVGVSVGGGYSYIF